MINSTSASLQTVWQVFREVLGSDNRHIHLPNRLTDLMINLDVKEAAYRGHSK